MRKLCVFLFLLLAIKSNLNYPNTYLRYSLKSEIKIKKDTTLFSQIDFNLYTEYIKKKESRGKNDYKAENSLGYLGAYQFGSIALCELGFVKIKPDSIRNKQWLSDNKNWLGKLNCWSKEGFKINKLAQDVAFMDLTYRNYCQLRHKGIRDSIIESNNLKWEGVLAACHLCGADTTVYHIRNKSEITDGFGTSISKYINLQ